MDMAWWESVAGNRGRPVCHEGHGLNVVLDGGVRRESDRVIVPLKPGNAGGGKDPDFWSAFEEGEDEVIDDESSNT